MHRHGRPAPSDRRTKAAQSSASRFHRSPGRSPDRAQKDCAAVPAPGRRTQSAADRAARHWGHARRPTGRGRRRNSRSEEHTSELQSLMRISYAVFCLKKKNTPDNYIHFLELVRKSADNNENKTINCLKYAVSCL